MIIPGIFEKDFEEIKNKVKLIDEVAPLIQIDFADGKLVDGQTFLDISKLEKIETKAEFDIHLMVSNPTDFVMKKVKNITKVCTQIEVNPHHIMGFIMMTKKVGYKIGLSIEYKTPTEILDQYVSKIDYVQFMTITPGGSGRPFNEETLKKISDFRAQYKQIPIQVDGGINEETLLKVLKAGANDAVMTSEIFWAQNPKEAFNKFKKIMEENL